MCLTWRELRTNKLCQHSVCSLKCLFLCVSIYLRGARGLPNAATCPISSLFHLLDALPHFPFICILFVSTKPARFPTPTAVFLSLSPGRLPGREPRWCSGEAASSGSLSLQDVSMARLCPIWPRPILAPVCDCAPAGGRQSWRTKPCQYPAEFWGNNRGDWILLQYRLLPLEGVARQQQLSGFFFPCKCDLCLHNYP